MIYNSATELIGKTPLIRLSNIEKSLGLKAHIIAKAECFNPAGSSKDRVALAMLMDAKDKGIICDDSVIIEPTSGNTGIGLASVCAAWGLKIILTMPDTMSIERRTLLKAYGAQVVLTEGAKGIAGAVEKANELASQIPYSFIPSQFSNPINPKAHYESTGPELFNDCEGCLDFFVAGIGTGGTISGVGRYLKEKKPSIKIIAVEPESSPLLSQGKSGAHAIQGIGANFVPDNLDKSIYNEIIAVSNNQAMSTGKLLAQKEGLLCGISSGAALYAAIKLAERRQNAGKTIAVLLPDTGERYLSTPMFD